jgi:hypothetical protein
MFGEQETPFFCDAMEKRDYRVFEDVFHAVVDKAQMITGRMKKQF